MSKTLINKKTSSLDYTYFFNFQDISRIAYSVWYFFLNTAYIDKSHSQEFLVFSLCSNKLHNIKQGT